MHPALTTPQGMDPLKRVFVPIENRSGFFQTSDRCVYQRDQETGTIRRAIAKVRGKAARRADKRTRRAVRAAMATAARAA